MILFVRKFATFLDPPSPLLCGVCGRHKWKLITLSRLWSRITSYCCFDDPLLGKALGRVQRRAESDLCVADVVGVPEAGAEVGDGLRDGVFRLQELVAEGLAKSSSFLELNKFLLRGTLLLRNKELYY